MPKTNRSGKATVLNIDQLEKLWSVLTPHIGLSCQTAYYTASRITEVLELRVSDMVGDRIIFRSANTKTGVTKTATINPALRRILDQATLPKSGPIFPVSKTGRYRGATIKRYTQHYQKGHRKHSDYYQGCDILDTGRKRECMGRTAVDSALRKAIAVLGGDYLGVTTHTFRRSMLTRLRCEGWHYEELCKISGHKSIAALIAYLDVDDAEVQSKFMLIER